MLISQSGVPFQIALDPVTFKIVFVIEPDDQLIRLDFDQDQALDVAAAIAQICIQAKIAEINAARAIEESKKGPNHD